MLCFCEAAVFGVILRQAGTWAPLLQGCSACTWTRLSSSNKRQRNYMRLKITGCMHSWGKFWTKDTKRPKNPSATFEGPRAKAGYFACPLHTTPPKWWANHPSHPSVPTPGHTPTLTPYKERARPRAGSKQGNLLFVLTPCCCSGVPSKALPEFLVWPLINFYWLRRPRALVGNNTTFLQYVQIYVLWAV